MNTINLNMLPMPDDAEGWRKRIAEEFGLIAKPVDRKRLRDATPLPWDSTPFPADVEL